jgi:hypothetical protein
MQRRAAILGIDKAAPPANITFNLVAVLAGMVAKGSFEPVIEHEAAA